MGRVTVAEEQEEVEEVEEVKEEKAGSGWTRDFPKSIASRLVANIMGPMNSHEFTRVQSPHQFSLPLLSNLISFASRRRMDQLQSISNQMRQFELTSVVIRHHEKN